MTTCLFQVTNVWSVLLEWSQYSHCSGIIIENEDKSASKGEMTAVFQSTVKLVPRVRIKLSHKLAVNSLTFGHSVGLINNKYGTQNS